MLIFVHLEISPHIEGHSSRPHYEKQGSSGSSNFIFQQIYNAHILYKHNTCNIMLWWLSVRCKAHLADNKSNAKSQAFCHFSSPALYVQERTSLAVQLTKIHIRSGLKYKLYQPFSIWSDRIFRSYILLYTSLSLKSRDVSIIGAE